MTFKKMILVVAVLLVVATVTMSAAAQEAVSKNKGTTTDPNAKPRGIDPSATKNVIPGAGMSAKTGAGKDASETPKVEAQEGK
jgi:hypothetical protein